MAYSSTNPPRLIVPHGLSGAAGGVWLYQSTHQSSDVTATGFFAGAGVGSRSHSAANVGMRVGDMVMVAETTGTAGTPGRATLHMVTASTADQASTSASTGHWAAYDVTISSTST
jgi:hypothetical protein